MADLFLGIDLGGTNCKVAFLEAGGLIAAQASILTRAENGPGALVERIVGTVVGLMRQHQIMPESFKALGIGSPGPLSLKEGKIVNAGNLPGFDQFHMRGELSSRLERPAVFDNDANAACWGEFWIGAGKDLTDMVLFTLGTGVGGGLVVAGELVHGAEDNGAELGHMIIRPGGRLCTCGQHGCLEAHASASHTAAKANDALNEGRQSSLQAVKQRSGMVTCKDVFDHAVAGDGLANEIVDDTATALAQGCVNMRHISEPQAVVLTGGMVNAGSFLAERVQKFYDEMIWTLKPEPMAIRLAELGSNAGMIGAAGLALHAWQQKKLYPVGI